MVDTSIKHPSFGQSNNMVKGCVYNFFNVVDTPFSYGRALIVFQFLQESSKVKESTLHEI